MLKRVVLLASLAACSSRTTPAQEARDAESPPPPSSAVVAPSPAASAASPAPSAEKTASAPTGAPTREELVAYLKKNAPKGGAVEAGDAIKLTHTVSAGDTYPAIAAAYLDLTEIYAASELARAIEKKNPSLVAGSKIEIPAVLTRAPRDPREEKLGLPEDKALRALFMTGPFIAQKWVESLDKMAARGINAVILDAKDYQGPVTYPSKAKIAVEIGAAAKPPSRTSRARSASRTGAASASRCASRASTIRGPTRSRRTAASR